MEIEKCRSSGEKEIVTPPKIDDCIFVQVDSWNAAEHVKSCDTLFIMSDGSGAYFWNGSKWEFLNFSQSSNITQIRTTIGVSGISDSKIFNSDVIVKADLLWTKQELPEGNLVLVVGEFEVKSDQTESYKNIFWTTPEGFELLDVSVVGGQFIEITHWTPVTSASLNAVTNVSGTLGWSNYASISKNAYTINATLRAI